MFPKTPFPGLWMQAAASRAVARMSALLFVAALSACGGGGGGSVPRFALDASGQVMTDNATGLLWSRVTPGATLASNQRLPTVDELLYLTDKSTLSDIPTQFSSTLLNNDLVFASDTNYSAASAQWAVSFVPADRGALYVVRPTDTPTPDVNNPPKQLVVMTNSPISAGRSRASSNYSLSTKPGVIYDTQNDLSWKMCTESATAVVTCSGTPTAFGSTDLSQFDNRSDGWRLPTKYELEALLDRSHGFEATPSSYLLNTSFFDLGTASNAWWSTDAVTGRLPRIYWTSTKDSTGANNFVVSFDEGSVRLATPGSAYYVRLVRNGKY